MLYTYLTYVDCGACYLTLLLTFDFLLFDPDRPLSSAGDFVAKVRRASITRLPS